MPEASAPPPARRSRPLVLVFAACGLIAAWSFSRSWHASILDRYEFRQLQTAVSAYWMKVDGFQLAYETPLFGPPWSIPMEFPTYQACVATVSKLCGLPLESSGRLVSILFFVAALPALYGLLDLAQLAPSRRLLALAAVLTTPTYLFYARTFMIETAALCLSCWTLYLVYRATRSGDWRWIVSATLCAALAALTKITTFAVFCVPAAWMAWWMIREKIREAKPHDVKFATNVLGAAIPVGIGLVAAWWWVRLGDGIKDSNPFTGFLTARELRAWNFGPIGLRFEGGFWLRLHDNILQFILTQGALAVAVVCAPFAGRRRVGFAAVCLAGFFAGPLVFANLYHIHDYYFCANAVFLTGAAGVILAGAWDDARLPAVARWLAVILVCGLQLFAYDRSYGTYHHRPAPPPPGLATVIRETVPADGVVLIYGADWNPLLPYYAERHAVMVPGERENETAVLDQVLQRLPPRQIAAIVMHGNKFQANSAFIRERAARFGFSAQPYARSGEDYLYLPEAVVNRSLAAERHPPPGDVELLATPAKDDFAANLKAQDLAGIDLSMMSPHPHAAASQFGISAADVEGRHVINAHASSELRFRVPPGAKHVQAAFGLPAAAYAPGQAATTDGIVVEVFGVDRSGTKHLLSRRVVDPARNAGDRGLQSIEFGLPDVALAELLFRVGPGAANNPANDWAYWSKIEIR